MWTSKKKKGCGEQEVNNRDQERREMKRRIMCEETRENESQKVKDDAEDDRLDFDIGSLFSFLFPSASSSSYITLASFFFVCLTVSQSVSHLETPRPRACFFFPASTSLRTVRRKREMESEISCPGKPPLPLMVTTIHS